MAQISITNDDLKRWWAVDRTWFIQLPPYNMPIYIYTYLTGINKFEYTIIVHQEKSSQSPHGAIYRIIVSPDISRYSGVDQTLRTGDDHIAHEFRSSSSGPAFGSVRHNSVTAQNCATDGPVHV